MTITPERKREICRRAGQARAKAFDSEYQRNARSHVRRESLQAAGHKAFAAHVAKHGLDRAMEHLAQWRRDHPNTLERKVIEWLDQRGVAYLRESRCAGIYVDFLLDDGKTVIEVDGRGFHTNGLLDDQDREGRDAMHNMVLAANGYRVIRLAETQIRNGSAFTRLEIELFAPPASGMPDDDDAVYEALIAQAIYTPKGEI